MDLHQNLKVGKILEISQPAVYGPAPDPSVSKITGGPILPIVVSILLFIIGLIVILNKKINKKVKIITVIILFIVITALLWLCRQWDGVLV